ncbi:MAG: hypothetical protein IPP42_05245 [Saprospiraceae bacterium]|nr:hypothetical protein [Saprospiraceae bacterium]
MITANELKIKGIKAIEASLKDHQEVGITVRGKIKYVVMTLEQYEYMRQIELDHAYQEVMQDFEKGIYVIETAEEHISRVWKESKIE